MKYAIFERAQRYSCKMGKNEPSAPQGANHTVSGNLADTSWGEGINAEPISRVVSRLLKSSATAEGRRRESATDMYKVLCGTLAAGYSFRVTPQKSPLPSAAEPTEIGLRFTQFGNNVARRRDPTIVLPSESVDSGQCVHWRQIAQVDDMRKVAEVLRNEFEDTEVARAFLAKLFSTTNRVHGLAEKV